jgi:hypothetical protein
MAEPRVSRPYIKDAYGIPDEIAGTLDWSWAVERLVAASVYWVASVSAEVRPHVMPTWGAWVDGAFWMEGGANTKRFRNLAANPAAVVSIERGDDVVIVEGDAERVMELDGALTQRLLDGYAKYIESHSYTAQASNWDDGIWRVMPRKVFGWSKFPEDTTRWEFDR